LHCDAAGIVELADTPIQLQSLRNWPQAPWNHSSVLLCFVLGQAYTVGPWIMLLACVLPGQGAI
jgi:hypothetical protein